MERIKFMIKIYNKKKNPHISDYGYHLTHRKNLDNILKNGLKRKIYHKKDNYERWVLNNVLYKGKSPIYFFANVDINKKLSEELRYEINKADFDIMLKCNVNNFNQLADIPHFLDFSNILLEVPEKIENSYLKNEYGEDDLEIDKIFRYNSFLTRGTIPIKKFLTDDSLNESFIFYTETFCIAEDIPSKYIIKVINL